MTLEVELPDEVLRYFEFIPKGEVSGIFAELLVASVKDRVTGKHYNNVFDGSEFSEYMKMILPNISLSVDTSKNETLIGKVIEESFEVEPTTTEDFDDDSSVYDMEGEDDDDMFSDVFK